VEFDFDCGNERCISYYLEYLLLFAPFSKTSLNIHLLGNTNYYYDSSIDSIHQSLIPLLKNSYNFDNELQMKVLKRGYMPLGGGEVHFVCPSIKSLNKVTLTEKGYIKRIRGVCAGSKISTSLLNRAVSKCREVFNEFIPDVWIFTDFFKGDKASQSPGYSLSLVA
jgi:RNA 3'-terminal phosphate cyclase-like protein